MTDLKPLTNAFFRLPGTSAFPPLALLLSLDSDSLVLGRIPFASVDDMLMMNGTVYSILDKNVYIGSLIDFRLMV